MNEKSYHIVFIIYYYFFIKKRLNAFLCTLFINAGRNISDPNINHSVSREKLRTKVVYYEWSVSAQS